MLCDGNWSTETPYSGCLWVVFVCLFVFTFVFPLFLFIIFAFLLILIVIFVNNFNKLDNIFTSCQRFNCLMIEIIDDGSHQVLNHGIQQITFSVPHNCRTRRLGNCAEATGKGNYTKVL